MKLTRLEEIVLHKIVKVTLPDGERTDSYDEGTPYQALIQYLTNDRVAVATYGADVDKIHRVSTLHNELEKFLISKVRNKQDNVSNYVIKYNGNYYNILKVNPRWLEMKWR